MASIDKRGVDKRGKTLWRARYRCNRCADHPTKPAQHTKQFSRRVDAENWLKEITASLVRGDYISPSHSAMTVAAIAKTWLSNPEWAASTRARNLSILNGHVLPRWGAVRLSDVTHEEIQIWVNGLVASGRAGGTVRKIAGVLSGILALAVQSVPPRLNVNPAGNVKLPKQALTRRRYLNASQVEALAEASDEYGDLVLVLAYCGLRIGEAAALRVRNVDMLRKRLRVEESVTEVDGHLVWSPPKDHQRRSVPFPDFLVEDIAARCEGKTEKDLLFSTARGAVLRVRNLRRDWFDMATVAADVEDLTPHELRHTAASLAVSAGASVLVLQRMLGHDKPSTTLDVYSDLFDEDLDALAAKLTTVRARGREDFLRTNSQTGNADVGSISH